MNFFDKYRGVVQDIQTKRRGTNPLEKFLGDNYELVDTLKSSEENFVATVYDKLAKRLCVVKQRDLKYLPIYRTLKALDNPHVPKIYRLFERDGKLVVVEEHVDGQTLEDFLIYRPDEIDESLAEKILLQLCDCLAAVHAEKIIHRDLKPANIMLTEKNFVKLVDFGIARIFKSESSADTEKLGTRDYAPPEQFGLFNFGQSDPRSDIYSLGVTMKKFLGDGYDGRLKKVLDKCTALEPARRFQSVDELRDALGRRKNFYHGRFFKGVEAMSRKKLLDIAILILFFVGLASNFMSAQVHEAAGIIFCVGVVAHNILNRSFYKSFLSGKFSRRRILNHATIILFAAGILTLAVTGAALAEFFPASTEINWRSLHLGAAIVSLVALFVHLLIHASRYVKGKFFYATAMLAFVLAVGGIFGLPYVDRWFHKVEVNRAELLLGEQVNLGGKVLIVYFSRVGNTNFPAHIDAVSGASLMVDGEEIVGNAQMISDLVQSVTGGEIFALRTEKVYPADYSQTVQVAKQEFSSGELPALKSLPAVDGYDKIILIYPLWWHTLPKPVENFLRSCDLSGKKIFPIVTHGGGGFGESINSLKTLTDAEISAPLEIYSSDIPSARKNIFDWLKSAK